MSRHKTIQDRKSISSSEGDILLDNDLCLMLFVLGLSEVEIARKSGLSAARINQLSKEFNWPSKRDAALAERAKRIGVGASREQEFIRSQECHLARQLMGLGHQILSTLKPGSATVSDLCRVLELASKLGRLGSGLPLVPIEINTTHEISDDWKAALDRLYPGEPQGPAIDVDAPAKVGSETLAPRAAS